MERYVGTYYQVIGGPYLKMEFWMESINYNNVIDELRTSYLLVVIYFCLLLYTECTNYIINRRRR